MKDKFLISIQHKIAKKQKINYGLTFVFSLSLMIIMTFTSMQYINDLKLNLDWQHYQKLEFAKESYEWEYTPEMSEEEIYQYLLEEMDVYHFIDELSEEEQNILFQKIKLKG